MGGLRAEVEARIHLAAAEEHRALLGEVEERRSPLGAVDAVEAETQVMAPWRDFK